MPSPDQRTFRFLLNGRTAQAYAYGAERVGLVLPADSMTVSVHMTTAEMRAAVIAMDAAITVAENVLATGLGESAVEVQRRAISCSTDPSWLTQQLATEGEIK